MFFTNIKLKKLCDILLSNFDNPISVNLLLSKVNKQLNISKVFKFDI